jgi:hypothetical protein
MKADPGASAWKSSLPPGPPWLAFDGILILIVPHYVIDGEFAAWIAKSYADVRVFMAPEQRFKQLVLLGRKRRSDRLDVSLAKRLEAIGAGELPPELPEAWADELYAVPEVRDVPHFVAARIQPRSWLTSSARSLARRWPQFEGNFGPSSRKPPPACGP